MKEDLRGLKAMRVPPTKTHTIFNCTRPSQVQILKEKSDFGTRNAENHLDPMISSSIQKQACARLDSALERM